MRKLVIGGDDTINQNGTQGGKCVWTRGSVC